jgi:hypothetical protein
VSAGDLGFKFMTTRKFYLDKADACLATLDRTRDPAERAALNQIARSYMRLADYVGVRQERAAFSALPWGNRPGPVAIGHPELRTRN